MALFVLKPILWNTNSYIRPSGVRATSGFPKETGYGHEEWNNSPRVRFTENGQVIQSFHTEGVGKAPVADNVGQTFVFMTASHDRVQQLVGIAGNATHLVGTNSTDDGADALKAERERLGELLQSDDLCEDAWAVPRVKQCYKNDRQKFLSIWGNNKHWVPNWICPASFYLWFERPVILDPVAITGKSKLLTMFGQYTLLDAEKAGRIMNSVPDLERNNVWQRLVDAISVAPEEPSRWDDLPPGRDPITSKLALVQSRRGQGQFREDLMVAWERACAVSGLSTPDILRASHIKRWADSTAKERLTAHNGLLLSANLDALFDRGLISFADDGKMLMSHELGQVDQQLLGLPKALRRPPSAQQRAFLVHHRQLHAKRLQ